MGLAGRHGLAVITLAVGLATGASARAGLPEAVLEAEAPSAHLGREPIEVGSLFRRVQGVAGGYWHLRVEEESPAGTQRRLLDRGRHRQLEVVSVADGQVADASRARPGGELTVAAGSSVGLARTRTLVLLLPDGVEPGELVIADHQDALSLRYAENLLVSLYLGIGAAMLLYNFLIFAYLRERTFLSFTAFVGAITALGLEGTGLGWTVVAGRGFQVPFGLELACLLSAGTAAWLWADYTGRIAREGEEGPPSLESEPPRYSTHALLALLVLVAGGVTTALSGPPDDPTAILAGRYALLPACSFAAIALALGLATRARQLRHERETARRNAEQLHERTLSAQVEAAEQLRALREDLLHQLIDAQESERRRLAAELHDSLGQGLVVVKQSLRGAAAGARGEDGARLQGADDHTQACIDEVRSLSRTLHPDQLRRLGLRRAAEAAAEGLCREHDAVIDCRIDGAAERAIGERALAVYRILPEAMSNAVQHGRCRFAEVVVAMRDGQVELSVSDAGAGFDPEAPHPDGAMGLLGVQLRVRALSGELQVDSEPGEGTHLVVRFPVTA